MIGDYPRTPMEVVDNTKLSRIFIDFMTDYVAGLWTVTEVEAGAGDASQAAQDIIHGGLLLTNDAAITDSIAMQLVKETIKFISGKETFFKIKLKISDATLSFFMVGVAKTDTTPADVSDGVFFSKAKGVATVFGNVRKNGTTSTTASSLHTVVAATYIELAFLYDGATSVIFYVNGIRKGTLSNINLPDDEELTVTIMIENGEAVIKTMTIEYIEAGQER